MVMASFEQYEKVNIWWFAADFCQARYGKYQESGNNSCTLISLIFANKLDMTRGFSQEVEELPAQIWDFIGYSINGGNKVYHDRVPDTLNISVPAAILAIAPHKKIGFQLVEWFYTQVDVDIYDPAGTSREIAAILKTTLKVIQHPDLNNISHLFAAIIADSRTVMLSFDLNTSIASFFDSHQHGENAGAVFAQATIENIESLMYWYITMLDTSFCSRPHMYEITFLSSHGNLAELLKPPYANSFSKSQADGSTPEIKSENLAKFDEETKILIELSDVFKF